MTSGPKSLTQPPESLKEAVDWVLCMSGYDGIAEYQKGQDAIKTLAAQVKQFFNRASVSSVAVGVEGLFNGDTSGKFGSNAPIASLASGLKGLIQYPNGMGIENYAYSYSDGNPSQTVNDEKSAKMFLATIPLIYFGLGFFFWKCKGGWKNLTLGSGPLKRFMNTIGFTGQLDTSNKASEAGSWFSSFDEFRGVESSPKTFTEYLKEVKEQTTKTLSSDPNYVPLGALYLFTFKYFKEHKSDLPTNDGIPQNAEELTSLLQKLGEAVNITQLGSLTTLSKAYNNLSDAIDKALKTPDPVEESSVAGPVSGAVVTAGLLGGGSAVYFNLGGAGTFLRGILRIP
ncbi:variant erythrocyte surface antigen-1 family protein [Babesia caballi]|uniref:Variant erythrocyte surface antigen-1 family protein n=1 Tax=Babesia caballi TaxID=5871 RepID=A0AAV4LLD6_BABCB|nr:variant erythrocyte surface antigen-1 family protein [Babesia caballi]